MNALVLFYGMSYREICSYRSIEKGGWENSLFYPWYEN